MSGNSIAALVVAVCLVPVAGVFAALDAALVPLRERASLVEQVRREADELLSALQA